jgi:hypothetical protein
LFTCPSLSSTNARPVHGQALGGWAPHASHSFRTGRACLGTRDCPTAVARVPWRVIMGQSPSTWSVTIRRSGIRRSAWSWSAGRGAARIALPQPCGSAWAWSWSRIARNVVRRQGGVLHSSCPAAASSSRAQRTARRLPPLPLFLYLVAATGHGRSRLVTADGRLRAAKLPLTFVWQLHPRKRPRQVPAHAGNPPPPPFLWGRPSRVRVVRSRSPAPPHSLLPPTPPPTPGMVADGERDGRMGMAGRGERGR